MDGLKYKFTLGDTVKTKSGIEGRIIGQAYYPGLKRIEVRIKPLHGSAFTPYIGWSKPKTLYRNQNEVTLVKKSNWREDENIPFKYVTDKGYEVTIEAETDPERGNETGKYEISLWLAKGGYYETIQGGFRKFDKAVKEMEIWVSENPDFGE